MVFAHKCIARDLFRIMWFHISYIYLYCISYFETLWLTIQTLDLGNVPHSLLPDLTGPCQHPSCVTPPPRPHNIRLIVRLKIAHNSRTLLFPHHRISSKVTTTRNGNYPSFSFYIFLYLFTRLNATPALSIDPVDCAINALEEHNNVLFPVLFPALYQYVSPIFVITIDVTGISYNGSAMVTVSVTIYLDLLLVSHHHQPAATRGSQNTRLKASRGGWNKTLYIF